MPARSSAAVGSSSSRQRVPAASARAISTICRCSTVRSAQASLTSIGKSPLGHDVRRPGRASAASPPGRPGCGWRPRNTFSATVRPGTTMECWNTVAIWRRQAADRAQGRSRDAVEAHLAAIRRVDAAQDGDQGGLACPVPADQAQAAARPQGEIDPAQGLGAAELLVDSRCLGRRDGGRGSGARRFPVIQLRRRRCTLRRVRCRRRCPTVARW